MLLFLVQHAGVGNVCEIWNIESSLHILVCALLLTPPLVCCWSVPEGESCPSNIWASSSSLTTHVFMHHNNCRVIWLSVMLRSSDLRDLLYCVEQWSVSNSAEWRRSKAVCPLHPVFSVRTVFVRIEPREKHVIQWLRVGSVSIAYDSDFYSSGNCSFRLCSYWLYSDFDPSCFFFVRKSPPAVDTRPD